MIRLCQPQAFLLDLVNDVLDMNKLESGEIAIKEEPYELTKIINEVSSVIETQADETGVSITRLTGAV